MNTPPNLIHRVAALVAAGKVILPLAMAATASAATMNFDYFGSGMYDNSGFFASTLTSLPAESGGGITQGTGFKLWGSDTLLDSAFYIYSSYYDKTIARSDGDGMALLWGGTISGLLADGDILSAPYDFNYAYTHTPSSLGESASASWRLTLGFVRQASLNWNNGISGGAGYTSSISGNSNGAGSFNQTGILSRTVRSYMLDDLPPPTHWYVRLEVLIPHENAKGDYDEPFPKQNGDSLTVSVPKNSIDLVYSPIPEPSSLLLSAAGGLLLIRRRRNS